jgi:hypothetical protein
MVFFLAHPLLYIFRYFNCKFKGGSVDLITLINLIFSITILFLGIKKYKETGAKAFVFIALGFMMYGISHFSLLLGWGGAKEALIAVRAAGYVLVITGLLV